MTAIQSVLAAITTENFAIKKQFYGVGFSQYLHVFYFLLVAHTHTKFSRPSYPHGLDTRDTYLARSAVTCLDQYENYHEAETDYLMVETLLFFQINFFDLPDCVPVNFWVHKASQHALFLVIALRVIQFDAVNCQQLMYIYANVNRHALKITPIYCR